MTTEYDRIPIEEVIRAADANHSHFFDPAAKRFFRSRWDSYAYKKDGFYYWVTSEQFNDDTPRLYTIRFACAECMTIDDIGGFQNHRTHQSASTTLHRILADPENTHRTGYHHWKMELKHVECPSEKTGGI